VYFISSFPRSCNLKFSIHVDLLHLSFIDSSILCKVKINEVQYRKNASASPVTLRSIDVNWYSHFGHNSTGSAVFTSIQALHEVEWTRFWENNQAMTWFIDQSSHIVIIKMYSWAKHNGIVLSNSRQDLMRWDCHLVTAGLIISIIKLINLLRLAYFSNCLLNDSKDFSSGGCIGNLTLFTFWRISI
jgi:hypothetical protein